MRVLFVHCWGRNSGDLAILSSAVRMIRNISPDSQITSLVSHPEEVGSPIDSKLLIWPWPVEKAEGLAVVKYPFILLSNFFSVIAYRLTGKKIFPFREFAFPLSEFFDADVVISPGGGFINPRYCFVTSLSEILFARILGKRMVLLAHSIGPFEGWMHEKLAGSILKCADLIIVREEKSAENLRKAGITNIHVTADLAFAFGEQKKGNCRNRVILSPKNMTKNRQAYEDYMERLAARIINETGSEVVFLPTDENDLEFQEQLAARLPVKITKSVHPPEKLVEIISDADFIVSGRMHGIILGAHSGTPFFGISDDFKFEAVLDSLCPGSILDIGKIEDEHSMDRIMAAIGQKEKLREKVEENFPKLREKTMENQEILRQKFTAWGY